MERHDHIRSHDHDHDHGHDHDPLAEISHVHGGPIVLDIGGDTGALVVLVGDERLGTELFVRSSGGQVVHTGVWRRELADAHPVAAAVFCQLAEGRYALMDGSDECAVAVAGGQVTEVDLRPT